jgi:hypothetical protein
MGYPQLPRPQEWLNQYRRESWFVTASGSAATTATKAGVVGLHQFIVRLIMSTDTDSLVNFISGTTTILTWKIEAGSVDMDLAEAPFRSINPGESVSVEVVTGNAYVNLIGITGF